MRETNPEQLAAARDTHVGCVAPHDHDDYERIRRTGEPCVTVADLVAHIDAQAEEIERLRADAEVALKFERGDSLRSRLAAEEEKNALYVDWSEHKEECEEHDRTKARLAECEAECLEQARLNGMGSEREARLLAKLAEVGRHLGNLLARIHRDGGHYQGKHGTEKAVADADSIVANLFVDLDDARAEAKKYHDALVARHGGEPIALLGELDAARAEVERWKNRANKVALAQAESFAAGNLAVDRQADSRRTVFACGQIDGLKVCLLPREHPGDHRFQRVVPAAMEGKSEPDKEDQ